MLASRDIPSSSTLVLGLGQLDLNAVHAVHAVHEQNQNENERNLELVSLGRSPHPSHKIQPTFKPYCIFATIGFSEMKVKTVRLTLKGSGMMRVTKTAISKTSSAKTWKKYRQHFCVRVCTWQVTRPERR